MSLSCFTYSSLSDVHFRSAALGLWVFGLTFGLLFALPCPLDSTKIGGSNSFFISTHKRQKERPWSAGIKFNGLPFREDFHFFPVHHDACPCSTFDTHFGTPDLVAIGVPDSYSSLEVSRSAMTSALRRRNKNKQPDGVVYFVRVVKCITLRLYFGLQPSVCFAFAMTTSKKDFLLLSKRLSCQLRDEINKRVEMQ